MNYTMKTLLLQQAGPDYTLVPANVLIPTPGSGEVRLRVTASSIDPVDYRFARNGAGLAMPHILGIESGCRSECPRVLNRASL